MKRARTRIWSDARSGKHWSLWCGTPEDPAGVRLAFVHGTERSEVPLDSDTRLDDLTDQELEALLDRAEKIPRWVDR